MSSRDEILARVRKNQPAARPLPTIPTFDQGASASIEAFKASVTRMGGKLADPPANGSLDTLIRKLFPDAKVICSATPEVKGNRSLEKIQSPGELNDVDVGVVRAVFGVAENGVVWLSEEQFKVNSLGFLAQHLIVLIDPDAIVTNMHRAYQRADFGKPKYAVFMTGPSATADIEGVLIHGAQGIRTMTVIPVSRSSPGDPKDRN